MVEGTMEGGRSMNGTNKEQGTRNDDKIVIKPMAKIVDVNRDDRMAKTPKIISSYRHDNSITSSQRYEHVHICRSQAKQLVPYHLRSPANEFR